MSKNNVAPPDFKRMSELIATPGPSDSPLPVRGNMRKFDQRIRWAEEVTRMLVETKMLPGKGRVPR